MLPKKMESCSMVTAVLGVSVAYTCEALLTPTLASERFMLTVAPSLNTAFSATSTVVGMTYGPLGVITWTFWK